MKKYNILKRNEKFERKIRIAYDFHNVKYEFTQRKAINLEKANVVLLNLIDF